MKRVFTVMHQACKDLQYDSQPVCDIVASSPLTKSKRHLSVNTFGVGSLILIHNTTVDSGSRLMDSLETINVSYILSDFCLLTLSFFLLSHYFGL